MSFHFTKNSITLTQGDTLTIPVDFHQPIDGATIRIQVYQANKIEPVIDKTITNHTDPEQGKTVLLIEKELTNIPAGEYQIQMTITFLDGNRYTFYPPNPATQASFHIIPAILF